MPRSPVSSSSRRLRACCSARISVGAMSAACHPPSTASSMANSATTVFPDPTSPWSMRFIRRVEVMSA